MKKIGLHYYGRREEFSERGCVKNGISFQLVPHCPTSLTTVTRGGRFTQGRLPCHSCASQTLLGICKERNRNKKQKNKKNITQDMLEMLHKN